ncbi:uncharacterized protein B0I36DRAFT_356275 [Microdochium trichocladiopsis]|uniref:Uncharacterized protein n=1 Tax=Microdochium trichocladiopsis TaxID=1682393 RepID=A0A9P8XTS9_9PEZI|nr:uncharacterized protein B0I36DRAFT_356831 [Microdochium trichocladiopsis]XP_046004570.1 uncharacterized protein B0I36DRAFT_356275 [Microdochium trichocladiopsis]KAH7009110.1 hypothetical protein B0I36DRAFT_356831 [Microdochium trichocladiopsis]KAH7012194.1 hypothetical protein B0I36DRAFT_356275 [Microdochium trichocladiopsis]
MLAFHHLRARPGKYPKLRVNYRCCLDCGNWHGYKCRYEGLKVCIHCRSQDHRGGECPTPGCSTCHKRHSGECWHIAQLATRHHSNFACPHCQRVHPGRCWNLAIQDRSRIRNRKIPRRTETIMWPKASKDDVLLVLLRLLSQPMIVRSINELQGQHLKPNHTKPERIPSATQVPFFS